MSFGFILNHNCVSDIIYFYFVAIYNKFIVSWEMTVRYAICLKNLDFDEILKIAEVLKGDYRQDRTS